jgi:GTP-binding protein
LGHVERCAVLLHLVDATQENLIDAYQTIRTELAAYDDNLAQKQEIVALTKCDALTEDVLAEKIATLKTVCADVRPISAVTGLNIQSLNDTLLNIIDGDANRQNGPDDDEADDKADDTADKGGWHPLADTL